MSEDNYKKGCTFCDVIKEEGEEGLTKNIIIEDPKTRQTEEFECDRSFYNDDSGTCIVTLAPEQYSEGHTLVILKRHADDMSSDLSDDEYINICKTIREVSKLLKSKLSAERIYVCSLCDGVKHLHFHLIPRYECDVREFCFMGDRVKLFNTGVAIGPNLNPENFEERCKWIASIAKKLRGES